MSADIPAIRTAIWQCEAGVSRRGGSCSFNVVLVQLRI